MGRRKGPKGGFRIDIPSSPGIVSNYTNLGETIADYEVIMAQLTGLNRLPPPRSQKQVKKTNVRKADKKLKKPPTRCPKGEFYKVNLADKSLAIHVPDQNSYLCDHCGDVWTDKPKFINHRRHVIARQNAAVIVCEICGTEMLELPNVIKEHNLKHHSGKTFDCTVCGKQLSTGEHLKKHMMTHEQAKLACRFCGKAIKYQTTLIEHERIHTGERPSKCHYCEERFTSATTRYLHAKKAHPEEILRDREKRKANKVPLGAGIPHGKVKSEYE